MSETRRDRLAVLDGFIRAATDPSRAAQAMRSALASGVDPRSASGQQTLRALQAKLRTDGLALLEERLRLLEAESPVHAARAWATLELCALMAVGMRSEGSWTILARLLHERPVALFAIVADGPHVVANVGQLRVALDHVGQRCRLNHSQFAAGERVLIPEPVAVANSHELVGDHSVRQLAILAS